MKPLVAHQIHDPTRRSSRAFIFPLPNGETACMEICIIPKPKNYLDPQPPRRPTIREVTLTLNAAAQTQI